MSEIVVEQLRYSYGAKEILKQISFSAHSGECLYVLGPNGVGKSTLFKCIMGHLPCKKGQVIIDHEPIQDYKAKTLAKKVAYISQNCHPSFNYTALELVMMGRTPHISLFGTPHKADYKKAYEVLEQLGIGEKAHQGIWQMSGGERQLAMIARALVQEAKILIMDEPTSNLDYGHQMRLQAQMKKLSKQGFLVIQSSHNPQQAMLFADKVVALYEGKVLSYGETKQVITSDLVFQLYGIDVVIKDGNLSIQKETEI